MTRKDVAAIHVLKGQLKLSDDDYRALLHTLTGVSSCTQMQPRQLQAVRAHLDGLVRGSGARPRPGRMSKADFERVKADASPRERKIWAMWNQLKRDGLIENASKQALDAWVMRQVHVSALRFCNDAQLNTLIEALKRWSDRP